MHSFPSSFPSRNNDPTQDRTSNVSVHVCTCGSYGAIFDHYNWQIALATTLLQAVVPTKRWEQQNNPAKSWHLTRVDMYGIRLRQ